jgi:hypothetical protein
MKRQKYLAAFVGTDDSMGLRKGTAYNIQVYATTQHPVVVMIDNGNEVIRCPYSSVDTFLQNWDNINSNGFS